MARQQNVARQYVSCRIASAAGMRQSLTPKRCRRATRSPSLSISRSTTRSASLLPLRSMRSCSAHPLSTPTATPMAALSGETEETYSYFISAQGNTLYHPLVHGLLPGQQVVALRARDRQPLNHTQERPEVLGEYVGRRVRSRGHRTTKDHWTVCRT